MTLNVAGKNQGLLTENKLILGIAWLLFGLKRVWTRAAGVGTSSLWENNKQKHKQTNKQQQQLFFSRGKENLPPRDKCKATYSVGSLHETEETDVKEQAYKCLEHIHW